MSIFCCACSKSLELRKVQWREKGCVLVVLPTIKLRHKITHCVGCLFDRLLAFVLWFISNYCVGFLGLLLYIMTFGNPYEATNVHPISCCEDFSLNSISLNPWTPSVWTSKMGLWVFLMGFYTWTGNSASSLAVMDFRVET